MIRERIALLARAACLAGLWLAAGCGQTGAKGPSLPYAPTPLEPLKAGPEIGPEPGPEPKPEAKVETKPEAKVETKPKAPEEPKKG
jgi:hypothetical protein